MVADNRSLTLIWHNITEVLLDHFPHYEYDFNLRQNVRGLISAELVRNTAKLWNLFIYRLTEYPSSRITD